jgi:cytochrome P450
MPDYLQQIDATPAADRWKLVRGWIFNEPLPFFAELRQNRPVLALPGMTLATHFDDCREILLRHDLFSVALYQPKQGDYWMDEDDTAVHWREKSIMKAILDREDIPAIRSYVADKAAALLSAAGGSIDAVMGLTRAVPIALVQDWFGFVHSDAAKLREWSYWNQIDAFWNQPFDSIIWPDPSKVVASRESANKEMAVYLVALIAGREAELKLGAAPHDSVSRLLALSASKAVNFDLKRVIINTGGLLIGAVETTSHAAVNAIEVLLQRPDVLAQACAAAAGEDTAAFDGFVYEALRFKPAFPYFFRTCEQDTVIGRGSDHETTVAKGTTVLAVTHSAMFDPRSVTNPERFDPTRDRGNEFHFGLGLHECLGLAIGQVMIPEIVRQSLQLHGLTAAPVDYKSGPVPEAWQWTWQH